MKKYDYLIFDLDNTLLDFSKSEYNALQSLFAKYGVVFNEETFEQYKKINHQLWSKLEEGRIKKETVLESRFAQFFATQGVQVDGAKADDEYRQFLENRNDLMDGAIELLEFLTEEGYTIYAGTNGVGRTQRKRLENANMTGFFKELYISEEIGFEKPDVRFFETIFSKEGIKELNSVLMIGDSLSSDIRGANRVGIDTIWLNNSFIKSIEDQTMYECVNLNEMKDLFKHL
ncbi:MAG: YjjG family noncanonical pyrimidine nucleotidase [Vagococcus sp.]|uniref:YjjG family noncanonical pyrimidine nucleotidase n=1 Tax=Vagococcus sp. TaxID=1933889 RepID=UPI002FCA3BA0